MQLILKSFSIHMFAINNFIIKTQFLIFLIGQKIYIQESILIYMTSKNPLNYRFNLSNFLLFIQV